MTSLLLKWVERTRRSIRVSFLRNVRLFKASLSNESISNMNSRSSLVNSIEESFEDVVDASRVGVNERGGVIVIFSCGDGGDFVVACTKSFETDLVMFVMLVLLRLKRFSIFCQNFIRPIYFIKIYII